MNEKKILHGNKARINPDKSVTPRFANYVINDYETRGSHGDVVFNRLEDDAEFCKKEVDDNKK